MSTAQLNIKLLSQIEPNSRARVPDYRPESIEIGHLHLGLGAFFRAHQAVYNDDILHVDPRWGISAASLMTPNLIDLLKPQDGLYVLEENAEGAASYRVIGSVRETLFAREEAARVLSRLARAETRVVTLTVTEKGYGHDPISRRLARDRPEMVRDLDRFAAGEEGFETPLGCLASGLRKRADANPGPISILSCDNLPSNGKLLAQLLTEYTASDPRLSDWIESHVSFPNTMVDRIVPGVESSLRARVRECCQIEDAAALSTESFRQWVIEDRFCGERPPWHLAGAQFVSDVTPYETLKLRLLNGSHSAIAVFGLLLKQKLVSQAIMNPALQRYLSVLMNEAASTLAPGIDLNVERYQAQLFTRFANPSLHHQVLQIATDGSQKLPQRWFAPALHRLDRGLRAPAYALAMASWVRCWELFSTLIQDPLAAVICERLRRSGPDAQATTEGIFSLAELIPERLRRETAFVREVANALEKLRANPTEMVLSQFEG